MGRPIRKLLPLLLGNLLALFVFQDSVLASPVTLTAPSPLSSQFQVHAQAPLALTAATAAIPQAGTGTLSFYFQNIELKSLLQLIGKISGLNFVISDAVKGNITLNLKNVTWQEALNIIMKTHGLTSRQIGNVMFINTLDEISKMDMKEFQADQQVINLAPLTSAVLQLKYMTAKDLADMLKNGSNSLLTTRGQIVVDPRTNTAVIRDVEANVIDIKKLVKKLDVPARQVMIEARIVNIDVSYEKELGIRFGLSNTRQLSGTFAGAAQLPQGTSVANITPVTDRLNFNNPAAILTDGAVPGSIGLALARLGPVLLDLELSALEEENHSEIISSPRVVTANQQKATIQTGQQIPYQESTSSGATAIAFENALLSLEITPQITSDNRIVLTLKATQDTAGQPTVLSTTSSTGSGGTSGTTASTSSSFGPPPINTEEVDSSVILNNNETVVLGGVYTRNKSKLVDRVPFFGSLPYIGALFRFTNIQNSRTELLIFITPKIIESKPVLSNKSSRKEMLAEHIQGGERG